MVKLADADIQTRDVLEWRGVHVLHSPMSSCSAKLRIFLNIKRSAWQSHEIDLAANQHITPWFLGINPRGLVPVLVHDGDVHIESNDILLYLEKIFPAPSLIPEAWSSRIAALLRHEDDLHLDLRTLSFRFVFNPPSNPKPAEVLERFASTGTGTVNGIKDEGKAEQIAFWERYTAEGISDAATQGAAERFKHAFAELDDRLSDGEYLLGNELTVLDIAWFIYVDRLKLAGYPVGRIHPRLASWYKKLLEKPEFASEVTLPPPLRAHVENTRIRDATNRRTLEDVAGI